MMKIWGEVPKVSQVYEKKNATKVDKSEATTAKTDEVTISKNAKDFQVAMKAMQEVSEIRQDKVDEIKEKYESGQYDVKGTDVADKILQSLQDKKSV